MKPSNPFTAFRPIAAIGLALVAMATPLVAQVIVNSPNIPVTYPNGEYVIAPSDMFSYHGPGLTVLVSNVEFRALPPITYTISSPNEIQDFNSQMLGLVSANGGPFFSTTGSGPARTIAYGKAGMTTGTFNTEMLSLSLSGTSPYGPFMLRESPTLASTGQTKITDLGGGLFQIDSFFDIFTELSVDGGATWIPSDSSNHLTLVPLPEPSVFALGGLCATLLLLKPVRRLRRKE